MHKVTSLIFFLHHPISNLIVHKMSIALPSKYSCADSLLPFAPLPVSISLSQRWKGMKLQKTVPKSHILNTRKMHGPREVASTRHLIPSSLWRKSLWGLDDKRKGG